MKGDKGWIKLHREIMDTKLWQSEPFTRAQAWVDLLLLANHATGHIRRRGILVEVERGAVGYSEETLAARWRWSRGKVRRFLDELIRNDSILRKTVQKKTSVTNLIYIKNYEAYQTNETEDSTEDGPKTVPEQELKNLSIKEEKGFNKGARTDAVLSPSSFKEEEKPLSLQGYCQKYGYANLDKEKLLTVAYFLDAYKKYRGEEHPYLRPHQWQEAIDNIFNAYDPDTDMEKYVDRELMCTGVYEGIIDMYFKKDFQDRCDYHLPHFVSGKIIYILACEYGC